MSGDQADLFGNVNLVIFHFDGLNEAAAVPVASEADDGFRQAWHHVFRSSRIPPEKVKAIAAHWEPSAEDREFILRTFPNLRGSLFMCARPEPGQWAQAAEIAAAVFEQALQHEATQVPETASGTAEFVPGESVLVPMLRTTPPTAEMVAKTLLPDRLYVVAAEVSANDLGTQDLSWVTHPQLDDTTSIDDVFDAACESLSGNLDIFARGDDDHSEIMLEIKGSTPVYLPPAAIMLPDFRERMSEILGGDRFVAAVHCHDYLRVMRADSPAAYVLEAMVLEFEHVDDDLLPTLFLIEPDGLRILTQATRDPA
ncbi:MULTISPECIES: hypothetical protein [unclassified Nocardia]|uniref:hypothetical protein n=1 Tax=unclassified Nocardia TaxID=2637762 RepID=UPI001CE49229|nr:MULTISPECIES: hypothetical protein [unclassified Nocardia]